VGPNPGRRRGVAAVGIAVDYGLDPLGCTLTRVTSGSGVSKSATHHYAADADTPSWTVDVDGGAETTTRYVSGGGGMLAMQQVDGQTVYPLYNPHGDMWSITDTGGDVIVTFSYDEYGNPAQAPTGFEELDRYGWLGQQQREWDPEVGVTLMGVRGYDPTIGRFLSVDPVYGGSANAYDYTAGDPINGYDLDGRWSWRSAIRRAGRLVCRIACITMRQGRPALHIANHQIRIERGRFSEAGSGRTVYRWHVNTPSGGHVFIRDALKGVAARIAAGARVIASRVVQAPILVPYAGVRDAIEYGRPPSV
jgi:RHS repeat-associated protein